MKALPTFPSLTVLLTFLTLVLSHQTRGQDQSYPYLSECSKHSDLAQCTAEKLGEQINKRLIYPQAAVDQLIEGTVIIGFTIDSLGIAHHLKVIKDIGGGCGQAALKAFPMGELWTPAFLNAKPISSDLTLPVLFALKDTLLTAANAFTIHWGNLSDQTHIKYKELRALFQQSPVLRNQNGDVIQPTELYYVRIIPTRRGKSKIKKFKTRESLIKQLKPDHSIVVVGILPYKRTFLEVTKEWIISR